MNLSQSQTGVPRAFEHRADVPSVKGKRSGNTQNLKEIPFQWLGAVGYTAFSLGVTGYTRFAALLQ